MNIKKLFRSSRSLKPLVPLREYVVLENYFSFFSNHVLKTFPSSSRTHRKDLNYCALTSTQLTLFSVSLRLLMSKLELILMRFTNFQRTQLPADTILSIQQTLRFTAIIAQLQADHSNEEKLSNRFRLFQRARIVPHHELLHSSTIATSLFPVG